MKCKPEAEGADESRRWGEMGSNTQCSRRSEAPAEDNTSIVIWGHSAQAGFLGDVEQAVADCSRAEDGYWALSSAPGQSRQDGNLVKETVGWWAIRPRRKGRRSAH